MSSINFFLYLLLALSHDRQALIHALQIQATTLHAGFALVFHVVLQSDQKKQQQNNNWSALAIPRFPCKEHASVCDFINKIPFARYPEVIPLLVLYLKAPLLCCILAAAVNPALESGSASHECEKWKKGNSVGERRKKAHEVNFGFSNIYFNRYIYILTGLLALEGGL